MCPYYEHTHTEQSQWWWQVTIVLGVGEQEEVDWDDNKPPTLQFGVLQQSGPLWPDSLISQTEAANPDFSVVSPKF